MNFNPSQLFGILRIVGPAVIAVLAQQHLITDNSAANWTALLISVIGSAAWSSTANSTLNLSKAVAAVPGLQVHVDEKAPASLIETAAAGDVRDIVPAAPAPFVTSTVKTRGF